MATVQKQVTWWCLCASSHKNKLQVHWPRVCAGSPPTHRRVDDCPLCMNILAGWAGCEQTNGLLCLFSAGHPAVCIRCAQKWACFWSPFWTDVLPSGWDCGFGQSKSLFGSVTLKSARLESKVTEAKLEICGEIVSCVQWSKQYLSALELNKKPERLKSKSAVLFPFYG